MWGCVSNTLIRTQKPRTPGFCHWSSKNWHSGPGPVASRPAVAQRRYISRGKFLTLFAISWLPRGRLAWASPPGGWGGGDAFPPVGKTGGYPPSPTEIAELPIFLTGIEILKMENRPFEKIVDQIRGVFNFWGSFDGPGLGLTSRGHHTSSKHEK